MREQSASDGRVFKIPTRSSSRHTHTYVSGGQVWGRMSTVCGMRGSAGPGDDEQRKWVSMDEWRETEGGEKRTEEGRSGEEKRSYGKVSFRIITGGTSTAGTEEGMDMCLCVTLRRG